MLPVRPKLINSCRRRESEGFRQIECKSRPPEGAEEEVAKGMLRHFVSNQRL
jgi:hypothetical protein